MTQVTIRFYDTEIELYEKLRQYRLYGFRSQREMLLRALDLYEKESPREAPEIDVESLAEALSEAVVRRLSVDNVSMSLATGNDDSQIEKALDFIRKL